jgi:hypothetical protein
MRVLSCQNARNEFMGFGNAPFESISFQTERERPAGAGKRVPLRAGRENAKNSSVANYGATSGLLRGRPSENYLAMGAVHSASGSEYIRGFVHPAPYIPLRQLRSSSASIRSL